MKTIVTFTMLAASVFSQEYPVGVVPGSPEDLAARNPAFRSQLTDLTRIGCKLRPDLGSGVNTEYGVITCSHCVRGSTVQVECDGETAVGTVVARAVASDVALISVPWTRQHPTVSIAADVMPIASGLSLVARSPTGSIAVQPAGVIGKAFDGLIMVQPPTVAGQSGGGYIDSAGNLVGIVSGNVVDAEPFRGLMIPASAIRRILPANAVRQSAGVAESAPTPYAEIERVLNLLPKPRRCFVDFGCGADARWCLAAAEKWQCKCIGMEIDPTRAKLAQERVKAEGFADLIEIYCADSTQYTYENCDVGVAYLYTETLQKLKPQIEKLTAFASMFHQPPVPAVQNGNVWIYSRRTVASQPMAVWGGQAYAGRVCNDPRCGMCAAIQQSIAQQQQAAQSSSPAVASQARGHYERRKICYGTFCRFENVWVPD